MSTYLLAFIIRKFNYIKKNQFYFSIKILAIFNKNNDSRQILLKLIVKILFFYKKIFNSQYFLPKIDMISIFNFNDRAIENRGLMTY